MWLNSTLVFSGVFGLFGDVSMGGLGGCVPGDISGLCFSRGVSVGWTLEKCSGEAVHRSKC